VFKPVLQDFIQQMYSIFKNVTNAVIIVILVQILISIVQVVKLVFIYKYNFYIFREVFVKLHVILDIIKMR